MSRYTFVSPGGMAGDAITDELTKRRAEARQQLIDQVSAQNVQSEIASRASRDASEAEWRAGEATRANAVAADLADKKTRRDTFHKSLTDWTTSHPEVDPKTKQLLEWGAMSGDDDLLKTVMQQYAKPDKDYNEVRDWQGHGTGEWAEGPTHYLQQPTHEPRDTGSVVGPALDEDQKPIPGKYTVMQNGKLKVVDIEGASGIGAKPSNAQQKTTTLPASMYNKLSDLRKKATPGEGWFHTSIGATQPSPGDSAAYQQQQQAAIAGFGGASQDVKDTISDILSKEPESTPTADILEAHRAAFPDPQEYDQFSNLLRLVRP